MAEPTKGVKVKGSKGTWRYLYESPTHPGQMFMECIETGIERWISDWQIEESK